MSNASIKERLTNVPAIVAFLGAGVSHPLGYPVTKTFIENFKEALKRDGKDFELVFFNEILTKIKEIQDIEEVLELLEALEDNYTKHPTDKFYTRFGISIEIGGGGRPIGVILPTIKNLREETEKEVFEAYRWQPTILNNAKKLYESFIKILKDKLADNKQIFIFTTNYDQVIEEVGSELPNFQLIDGFVTTSGRKHLWKPEDFNRQPTGMYLIKLFKLHGSLNWRERTDNKFERVATEERTLGNQTYKRNVLIYPTLTHKANHSVEYLDELYILFKLSIEQTRICIVVGYSFRDKNINDVFLEFLKRKGTALISLSPSASDNIVNNLLADILTEEKITA